MAIDTYSKMLSELAQSCCELYFGLGQFKGRTVELTLYKREEFVYFKSDENPDFNFRIHNLEFRTLKDGVFWGAKAYRNERTEFVGKYSRFSKNIKGIIKSGSRELGIVFAGNNGTNKIKTGDEMKKIREPQFSLFLYHLLTLNVQNGK